MYMKSVRKKRLFGTNGIRGIPNADLSPVFAMEIGQSIGSYFTVERIAIARDTRVTGSMIESAVASGIMSTGSSVIDLGILPTPALQYYCRTHGIYGVMITASHNPPQFNGIKCIDRDGTELSVDDEIGVEDIYYEKKAALSEWRTCGALKHDNTAADSYIEGILKKVDSASISKAAFRVAFDAGNGASYQTTPALLTALNIRLVSLNCNADGLFTSRESEPKPENLSSLIGLVKSENFDLGIAHDGDADRAVFIDEKGEFIDGDKTLSLIVKYTAKRGDVVVTPISSSDCISDVCKEIGATLVRTKVGAPIVSRKMIEIKAKIGGEENGGVIYSGHQFCRDGAMTAALVLQLMALTKKSISDLIGELPKYSLTKRAVQISKPWSELLKSLETEFSGKEIDRMDGIKINEGSNWVLIRPSGTEPIVRLYAQGRDEKESSRLADLYQSKLEKIMK
jgi:phosphomannomutase/phosphoglucomutase